MKIAEHREVFIVISGTVPNLSVTVNNQTNVRACLTVVEENMVVESGKQHPNIVREMVKKR